MSSESDWIEQHLVVSHWPPVKSKKKPKHAAERPLVGLPAMMHDLLTAAERYDHVFGRVTTSEGQSTRTPNPNHLSTGAAGRSRYDERTAQ